MILTSTSQSFATDRVKGSAAPVKGHQDDPERSFRQVKHRWSVSHRASPRGDAVDDPEDHATNPIEPAAHRREPAAHREERINGSPSLPAHSSKRPVLREHRTSDSDEPCQSSPNPASSGWSGKTEELRHAPEPRQDLAESRKPFPKPLVPVLRKAAPLLRAAGAILEAAGIVHRSSGMNRHHRRQERQRR